VFLPLRHRRSPKYMLPGLMGVALLALAQRSLLLDFLLIFLTTSVVMGPANASGVNWPRDFVATGLRLCCRGDCLSGYRAFRAWNRRAFRVADRASFLVRPTYRTPTADRAGPQVVVHGTPVLAPGPSLALLGWFGCLGLTSMRS